MASAAATVETIMPDQKGAPSALLLLLPTLLAFGWVISKAQWYWNHRPDMQFGWIVLMLCGFVLWEQWGARPAPSPRLSWVFFLGGLVGLGILFLMQVYQAAFGLMPAVMLGLTVGAYAVAAANIHYVYGWAGLRFYAFPLLFFLIALPLPSFLYTPLVNGLQQKVATANVEILNLIGIPAHRSGSLIQLPNGTVGVNEACSGIRSLQSTIMATLFIGYLTLQRRSLQITLLLLGAFYAVGGNLVRSLYLSLTANAKGIAAVEKVHDSAGWTILVFTAAAVALTAWLFAKLEKRLIAEQARIEAKLRPAGVIG
jgi:exosortase